MMNYLERCSCPDLSYAVNQCARYCADPKQEHVKAVKWIGRYIKATRDKGLKSSSKDQRIILCTSIYLVISIFLLLFHWRIKLLICIQQRIEMIKRIIEVFFGISLFPRSIFFHLSFVTSFICLFHSFYFFMDSTS